MSVRNVLHLGVENLLLPQIFTLSSDVAAETAYPLTNCQNQFPNTPTVIDMSSDSSVTLSGSGSTEYLANSFCLWNHNLPSDATIQILLYPNASQGGTPWDSGELPAHNIIPWGGFTPGSPWGASFESTLSLKKSFVHYFADDDVNWVAFKSFEIVIASAGGFTNDLAQFDKLWLGPSYVFRYGNEHGSMIRGVGPSEERGKPGGGMETIRRQSYRTADLNFSAMEDAEAVNITAMLNAITRAGDVLVSCGPNDTRGFRYLDTMIGRVMSDTPLTSQFFNGISTSIKLEEN